MNWKFLIFNQSMPFFINPIKLLAQAFCRQLKLLNVSQRLFKESIKELLLDSLGAKMDSVEWRVSFCKYQIFNCKKYYLPSK